MKHYSMKKSALLCHSPDHAALFNLLTTEDFNIMEGTTEFKEFTTKLTSSRDLMRYIKMV